MPSNALVEAILSRTSPKLFRLLARSKNGLAPLSNVQIAERAGLAVSTVAKLNKLDSWDKVPVRTALRFATGCGINLLAPGPKLRILKGGVFYMTRCNPSQRRMFDKLLPKL